MANFWQQLPKPFLALAPMAGVTDTAFRQMCKNYGADVIYTEFASADALLYENKKTRVMLDFAPMERPIVCQIFGREPNKFYKAVKILQDMGFDGVDINFGCPAYKVVKNGGGVSLMRNLNLCRELVQAACESSALPVSIKIRASIKRNQATQDKIDGGENNDQDLSSCNSDTVTALDLVQKIKDLPVAAIMIHARSFEQPFDGQPNLSIINDIRKIWSGLLMANGGITTPEIAADTLKQSPVDGLGIARGSWGKPWLFKQIKDFLTTGTYQTPDWEEIKKIMLEHATLALKTKGGYGLIELRKHLSWYVKGFAHASNIRAQLVQIKTLADVKRIIIETKKTSTPPN